MQAIIRIGEMMDKIGLKTLGDVETFKKNEMRQGETFEECLTRYIQELEELKNEF